MSASLTGATDFSWLVGNCCLVGCGDGCLCVVHIKCNYNRAVDWTSNYDFVTFDFVTLSRFIRCGNSRSRILLLFNNKHIFIALCTFSRYLMSQRHMSQRRKRFSKIITKQPDLLIHFNKLRRVQIWPSQNFFVTLHQER